MDLHRTGKRADWLKRPRRNYSWLQQVAKQTNGIVTPGNAITIVGFLLVLYGLWQVTLHHFGAAALYIGIGRLADVADGWVAHRTHTKSPVGEVLDATSDKIVTFLGLLALGVADVAPWWLLICLAVPHCVIALLAIVATIRHAPRLHPSLMGKMSMITAWVGLGCFLLAVLFQEGSASAQISLIFGYSLVFGSIILSSIAFVRYMRELAQARRA